MSQFMINLLDVGSNELAEAETFPTRRQTIEEFRDNGGLVAAVAPIHYPRALLRAFDILPVEVWGPPGLDTSPGDAHLQAYTCSIVRAFLSFLLTGGLDRTDLIVMPHACDSLQGLTSVLQNFVDVRKPVLPLYIPRGDREGDVTFLAEEIRLLGSRLAGISGKEPSREELLASTVREEGADRVVARLLGRILPDAGDQLAFYRLLRTREYLPAERFVELAERKFPGADGQSVQEAAGSRIPLILSGIIPEPMEVIRAIRDAGGHIVGDDTACCGRRAYPGGVSNDPYRRMAERIVLGPPDPMRGSKIAARLEHLRKLAETTGASGVLFYTVKYCEPELFDVPLLRNALRSDGLHTILVETDIGSPLSQQTVNRIEAFIEMIS